MSKIDEYAESVLAQRISTLPGVAQVQIFGPQKYAVRIQLDPNQLAARNIGVDEVMQAVAEANVNLPTGTLNGAAPGHHRRGDRPVEERRRISALDRRVSKRRTGAPQRTRQGFRQCRKRQSRRVGRGRPDARESSSEFNASRVRIPSKSSIRSKALLPALRSQMPSGTSLDIVYDRSQTVRASVHDVKITLGLSLVLVVIVIFAFLRNVRAAIIPSIVIPLSFAGTFAVMYLLDFSIDNLSLMALTLCVGFVVDDAIVMLENVNRHVEQGESPFTATLNGAKEIGFTIVSMTISLAAVFIPVLFMGGIVGRLFHEFAITIITAILISGRDFADVDAAAVQQVVAPSRADGASEGSPLRPGQGRVRDVARLGAAGIGPRRCSTCWHRCSRQDCCISPCRKDSFRTTTPDCWWRRPKARPDISFAAMAQKQQQAIRMIAQDPNVGTRSWDSSAPADPTAR